MIRTTWTPVLILLLPVLLPAQASSPKAVTAAEAESHIASRAEPAVSPFAQMTKIGGKVKMHITISPSGNVSSVKVLNGHPILIKSALEAVQRWKYRPFMEDGKPIAVETDVELDFPVPAGMSRQEKAARDRFADAEHECRGRLASGKYADAERKCRDGLGKSDDLPKEAILERSQARALLANAIFLQRRFQEAIPLYEEALALDKGYLQPEDGDLATDYANLARAYSVTGGLAKADSLFATAVSTFEAALQRLPRMSQNYRERLKRLLNEYAQLKDVEGQGEAAQELRKKAAAL